METKRCSIKITNHADYLDLLRLYNDTRVWEHLGGQRSPQQIEERIKEWVNPQENCHYWTVREKSSGAFLGCILLTPHYDGEFNQISYMFLSRIWGNGYAFEALSQVLRYSIEANVFNRLLAEAQSAVNAGINLTH